jgi:hypothetical protein
MAKTTFWDVIEKTIEKVGTPLSARKFGTRQMNLELSVTFQQLARHLGRQ